MKLLHLDSSILGGNSASRVLSAAIADQLAKATPGAGMPPAALQHVEGYVRAVFGFLGVTDLEFVVAEGLGIPEQRDKAMQGALQAVTQLNAATLSRAA